MSHWFICMLKAPVKSSELTEMDTGNSGNWQPYFTISAKILYLSIWVWQTRDYIIVKRRGKFGAEVTGDVWQPVYRGYCPWRPGFDSYFIQQNLIAKFLLTIWMCISFGSASPTDTRSTTYGVWVTNQKRGGKHKHIIHRLEFNYLVIDYESSCGNFYYGKNVITAGILFETFCTTLFSKSGEILNQNRNLFFSD